MSSEVEALASKLNASGKVSQILNSRGTEISGDKVIALDLSDLNISDLPSGVFDGFEDLVKLNLGYNQLTSVDSKVFAGLSKLTFLSFYSNQINELADDFLSGFPDLEWLDLRGNGLTKIPSSVLSLQKLVYLYLQSNPDLTTDEFDFSEDYHSKRDIGKFAEKYKKSIGFEEAEPATTTKTTRKVTEKSESEESSE